MLALRKSSERGYADHGWLKSYHSVFVCRVLRDPRFLGFGNLRVINEDRGLRHRVWYAVIAMAGNHQLRALW